MFKFLGVVLLIVGAFFFVSAAGTGDFYIEQVRLLGVENVQDLSSYDLVQFGIAMVAVVVGGLFLLFSSPDSN